MYLIIAILIFSFLIFIHEIGHFITAKVFGVRVNEFSIFMGPELLSWGKGETKYTLRLFPIGGYCAMEGENGDSDDPHAFTQKAHWKRCVILAAGAFMNFLTGVAILVVLYMTASGFRTLEVTGFVAGCELEGETQLQIGDVITAIDGENLYIFSDFSMVTERIGEGETQVTVLRDGKKLTLTLDLTRQDYIVDGQTQHIYGLIFAAVAEQTPWNLLKNAWYTAIDFGRMVKWGLLDLISGAVGVDEVSGVVGIVDTIQESGSSAASTAEGLQNVFYLGAFIAVNLAFMNLLPIPALDGGRIFCLIVTCIIEAVTRKRLNPKYEAYIHGAGLVILMGLMLLVAFHDIAKIITG